ncbi:hybrid sensor histidine kinase/response regulator [Desulfobacter vibrioformis]|uniref:hybrid sensor histidine kinase/response regulator n=1 Tax=Desulfobacter vibrioformis TaxID=34031 RepID=UPI0006921EDF|nr:hybrid sensor histidine kinase/response regulator [Desulfobacter vibrioformis]
MFPYNKNIVRFKHSVGRRFIVFILLFSSAVTFLGTLLQLYVEYSSDIKSIQKTFKQIESSYLQSLSTSLWVIDRQQADILLNGILQLPDIQHLEIWQDKQLFSSAGKPEPDSIIQHEFKLVHTYKGQDNDLGILIVTASLKGVYIRLLNRLAIIFVTQAITIFLVSAFIFFLFYMLVGRHLVFMASYAKNLNFEERYIPLKLERKHQKYQDELEHLVQSINAMNENHINHIKAVKLAEKEAEKAEKRLKRLIEKSPLPMLITHKNQDILFMNDKFTELFGYTINDVSTADEWWKIAYPNEIYREKVKQSWINAVERAQKEKKEIKMQIWELTTKERSRKTCEFYMVPLDEIGLIIINDISHRETAQLEKENLEKQLQQAQKLESIGRLAGGIAHDFNNMLSIILGNSEMLMEDLGANNQFLCNVKEIQKAAERSAALTRQLLAFARKQTISPKTINLNTAIEGMLKMLKRLIGEDIDLSWSPKKDLWSVQADPSQIDQMLANLCVNARDAIKDVGKVTIETDNVYFDEEYCMAHQGFKPGNYVLIGISDNGCGMDEEILDNLFEPFFTTKKIGEGTGLGLATVYGIIKQNKGFIHVYSEPGEGTTFKLYIPQHEDPRVEDAVISSETVQQGSETILLVEDEASILKMTKIMLERLGYHVLAANTPDEAIRICSRPGIAIHLLMTDVVMPSMNGRELFKIVIKLFPDIKHLFTSGYTANVIAHRGVLDEGFNFINKPFSKQDLSIKIRSILDEK